MDVDVQYGSLESIRVACQGSKAMSDFKLLEDKHGLSALTLESAVCKPNCSSYWRAHASSMGRTTLAATLALSPLSRMSLEWGAPQVGGHV